MSVGSPEFKLLITEIIGLREMFKQLYYIRGDKVSYVLFLKMKKTSQGSLVSQLSYVRPGYFFGLVLKPSRKSLPILNLKLETY